jgi:hypothetical protein
VLTAVAAVPSLSTIINTLVELAVQAAEECQVMAQVALVVLELLFRETTEQLGLTFM